MSRFLLVITLLQTSFLIFDINGLPFAAPKDPAADIEKTIREALENFRHDMKKGIPDFKIESLEPLVLHDISLKHDSDNFKIHLDLHEIYVEGLSGFQIQDLHADIPSMTFRIKANFPKLSVKGHYYLDGKIMNIVPIYGEGDYSISGRNMELGAGTKIILGEEDIVINPIKLHMEWEDIDINLGNFLGGQSFSEVLQRALPGLIKKLYVAFREPALEAASKILTQKLNEIVNSESFKDKAFDLIIKAQTGSYY